MVKELLEVKEWLKTALRDLESAKYNYKGRFWDVAAFYSQQAIEKALKSLQIKTLNKFEKTHDLVKLARSINAPQNIIKLCSEVTLYYTVTRYPDVGKLLNKKKALSLIKKSEKVIKWVRQILHL